MDSDFLREQAERCRRLAKGADFYTAQRLRALAAEYDDRIAVLERPEASAATRSLTAI